MKDENYGREGQKFITEKVYLAKNLNKSRLRKRSQDVYALRNSLGPLADCVDQIGYAWELVKGVQGYPSEAGIEPRIPSTGSKGGFTDKQKDLVYTWNEWSSIVGSPSKGISLDVCVFGFSVKETSWQRGKCPKNTMQKLKNALKEWDRIYYLVRKGKYNIDKKNHF